MIIHKGFEDIKGIKNPVVTIGSFDGVHLGHKVIIDSLIGRAKEENGESVVITFCPHPRVVLGIDNDNFFLINSLKEKEYMLNKAGVDHLVEVDFTHDFSTIPSEKFASEFLADKLKAKVIIIGYNHHFGYNRQGDFSYLYKIGRVKGFSVVEIPRQLVNNEKTSSTKIREAIMEGRMNHAANLLGTPYFFIREPNEDMTLVSDENMKLIPPAGHYLVDICSLERNMFACPAVITIKEDKSMTIETFPQKGVLGKYSTIIKFIEKI